MASPGPETTISGTPPIAVTAACGRFPGNWTDWTGPPAPTVRRSAPGATLATTRGALCSVAVPGEGTSAAETRARTSFGNFIAPPSSGASHLRYLLREAENDGRYTHGASGGPGGRVLRRRRCPGRPAAGGSRPPAPGSCS